MKKHKSVVLLSGGLDSAVNLALALKKTKVKVALTINYSQKAAVREIESAKKICHYYNIKHQVIDLPWFKEVSKKQPLKFPKIVENDLKNKLKMKKQAELLWVPNRNGLFVNIAAVLTESLNAGFIVMGLNREEGESFPDNSSDFVKAVNKTLSYSTLKKIKLISYTMKMNKKEIVEIARKYKIPLEHIWSCYLGQKKPCHKCLSCLRLKRAMS